VRQGTVLLIAYSLGLGLPFVVAGLGVSRFRRLLSFLTRHMGVVVAASGVMLIAVGLLFVTGEVVRIAIVSQRLMDRIPLLSGG
jgi:cytochrome c-type biogenesis protein